MPAAATPTPPTVTNTLELTDGEVAFYRAQGFLVLPGFVQAAHIAGLTAEVFDVLEAHGITRSQLAQASGSADKLRQNTQYLAGSRLDGLINGEPTKAVAGRLIGGPAHRYMPFTAVKAARGGGRFDFHQDNNYTQHDPAEGSINIWVALVDMTPANGCLMIVPGSHRRGQLESRQSDDGDTHRQLDVDMADCLPLRMHAGDAVAFTRWTVHGSGANHTDEPRVAYALQYHREDVTWLDRETGHWAKLTESPRWQTGPASRLGPDG